MLATVPTVTELVKHLAQRRQHVTNASIVESNNNKIHIGVLWS